jgi:hypothetical protein
LKNRNEWQAWSKSDGKPDDIPADPPKVYQEKGWIGWGDWLGTGNIASYNRTYRPFEEARAFANNLGLKNRNDWRVWSKSDGKPDDIPANPPQTYKNEGWLGWGDWLETGTIANQNRVYLSFEEARVYVRSIGLKNRDAWRDWSKSDTRPKNILRILTRLTKAG